MNERKEQKGKEIEDSQICACIGINNSYIFSLAKTADKMLKEAEHAELMKDEERAYVLFMKYFNVVTYMKKTADYKKDKVEALLFVCLAQWVHCDI